MNVGNPDSKPKITDLHEIFETSRKYSDIQNSILSNVPDWRLLPALDSWPAY